MAFTSIFISVLAVFMALAVAAIASSTHHIPWLDGRDDNGPDLQASA